MSVRCVSEIRVPFLHVFRFTRREQRGKSSPLGGPGAYIKRALAAERALLCNARHHEQLLIRRPQVRFLPGALCQALDYQVL